MSKYSDIRRYDEDKEQWEWQAYPTPSAQKELEDKDINDIYEEWRALSGDPVKLYRLFKLKEQTK